jgi:PAS domain S-box-containing protein
MPGSSLANLTAARAAKGMANLESGLLNSLGEAVIATDLNGYIIFWNRAAESLYGWTVDEVEGRNIIDVITNDNSRASGVAIFERLTKGERWSGEFETRHKDGHHLLVDVTDYPVRDQQGKLTAIVGISKLAATPLDVNGEPSDASQQRTNLGLRRLPPFVYRQIANNVDRPGMVRGLALAAMLYGLALAARLVLDQMMPGRLPFLTFFPAVLISSFICGLWPTLVLLFASAVTGAVLAAPDNIAPEFQVLAGALFVIIAGMMIALVVYAEGVRRDLKLKDQQLILLNRELSHRLKNLFAVTNSICVQTIKSGISREDLANAITGRIQAVASAQDLVSATAEEGSDLRALVDAVVKPISPDLSRLEIDGPQLSLSSETTIPFALILHELATNAVKYGAWKSTQGRVIIQWRLLGDRRLEFTWREENVSPLSAPQREGFGSTLIKRALNQAKVRYEIGHHGAVCQIELAL